ncbi:hypothetical protein ACG83_11025 [Frankia sp. R43]|uniref:hypothetical protein n=1 Tax=Frankia sp. R43 TaxID=269536 RepID=UPI0006CA2141|nr:hypothetical protein [Frankia sp. R43]KPM55797.1 hypothetical protein ACG83_11025 [Frankia sp. R43]
MSAAPTRPHLGEIEHRLLAGQATTDDVIDLIAEVRRLRGVEDFAAGMLFDSVVTFEGSTMSPLDLLEQYNPHLRRRLADLRRAAAYTPEHVDTALALVRASREPEPARTGIARRWRRGAGRD